MYWAIGQRPEGVKISALSRQFLRPRRPHRSAGRDLSANTCYRPTWRIQDRSARTSHRWRIAPPGAVQVDPVYDATLEDLADHSASGVISRQLDRGRGRGIGRQEARLPRLTAIPALADAAADIGLTGIDKWRHVRVAQSNARLGTGTKYQRCRLNRRDVAIRIARDPRTTRIKVVS